MHISAKNRYVSLSFFMSACLLIACSSSSGSSTPSGSGGGSSLGGSSASGGANGSGGVSSSGGDTATGGPSGQGGAASGGTSGSGGATSAGGSSAVGGSSAAGGAAGSGGGGSTGSGGTSGAGGSGTVADSGTSDDSGTSADGAMAGDAGAAGDGGLSCGTMTCNISDPTQAVCCIDYPAGAGPGGGGGAPTFSCVATASACQDNSGGMAVAATCGGSADCTDPANPVCCQVTDSNNNSTNQCASSCGTAYQFCHADSECPAGDSCTPLFGSGPTACSAN